MSDRIIKDVATMLGLSFKKEADGRYLLDSFELLPPGHDDNELSEWLVSGSSVVPGVRYTSNGDGWPDVVDVFDVGHAPQLQDALAILARARAKQVVDIALQNEAWAQIADDTPEYD